MSDAEDHATPAPASQPRARAKAPAKKGAPKSGSNADLKIQLDAAQQMIVQVTLRAEAAEKATTDVRAELETALKALAAAQNKPKEHAMRFPKPRKTDDKIGMGDIIACLELIPDLLPDSTEDDDVESKADGAYKAAQRYMRGLFIAVQLDRNEKYIDVRYSDKMAKICKLVRQECPYMKCFADDWATRALVRQYMRNSRATSTKRKLAGSSSGGRVRKRQRTGYQPTSTMDDDDEQE